MQEEDIQFPDVNYGSTNKEKYSELIEKEWSPFYGFPLWKVFIFCMSYAYANKLLPTEPQGHGTMNAKSFLTPTRHMMKALAIKHSNNIAIIKNSNEVVRICEKYANAGIEDVHRRFKNRPSEKSSESVFVEMLNDAKQSQN